MRSVDRPTDVRFYQGHQPFRPKTPMLESSIMLSQNPKNDLVESIQASLERMASVVAEPVTEANSPLRPAVASVSFSGAANGRVEIAAGEPFTQLLATSLLGATPGTTDAVEKADECLKELVKIVSGTLLPRMKGTKADVSATLRSLSPEWDWPAMAVDPRTQLFTAGGHTLAARVVETE
jgi:hypothetical protein